MAPESNRSFWTWADLTSLSEQKIYDRYAALTLEMSNKNAYLVVSFTQAVWGGEIEQSKFLMTMDQKIFCCEHLRNQLKNPLAACWGKGELQSQNKTNTVSILFT